MPQDGNSEEFRHDLIIAKDDGTILHIKREYWDHQDYVVDATEFQNDDGWKVVRQLLQCGVMLAAVPPKLPSPLDDPKPLGTCWLVNIEGLKQSTKFHVR
ncbi:hypothetical protein [Sinorhizobium terangae]|uniref:Uncharacterized protein n=1 Tax=Sinorhizobium terangae TaxID=110322 RepID=A0A6N7LFR8_SINTE|nr:hypothetical protein [Sinorhizobium terangae]MBB4184573.1 hypothetical protein [Sinorhizobium terangae]MQX16446.1 hypothetical protein [Sinorhizobium terangae]WFU50524.1 hypothetical protein QA637_27610 [Sinorhizobium terangae]